MPTFTSGFLTLITTMLLRSANDSEFFISLFTTSKTITTFLTVFKKLMEKKDAVVLDKLVGNFATKQPMMLTCYISVLRAVLDGHEVLDFLTEQAENKTLSEGAYIKACAEMKELMSLPVEIKI